METGHPRIMRAVESSISTAELESTLNQLEQLCLAQNVREIHACFEKLRIGFVSAGHSDHLTLSMPAVHPVSRSA
jgi:hypothetical protein